MTIHSTTRIFAIDPSTRGFGFVVLEGRTRLVDWGLIRVGKDKNRASLKRIEDLIAQYEPGLVVVEDTAVRECRRRTRARHLIQDIADFASFWEIPVLHVPWNTVRQVVGGQAKATKSEVAAAVVARFPEIADREPPKRKAWMKEDDRMALMDAAALALAASGHAG